MNLKKNNFLKNLDFKTVLKFGGIGVFVLLVLGLLLSLSSFAVRTAMNIVPSYRNESVSFSVAGDSAQFYGKGGGELVLSSRNVATPDYGNGYTAGSDLEDFEATEYSAYIRTGRFKTVCGEIESWKNKSYVIFESSNRDDNYCSYFFKVVKKNSKEILDAVKKLNPENLNVNTETIKKQIDDFTSEEEILTNRLEQVENTLEEAQEAYDDLTSLATRSQDVESLAKIINDKIILIEKLTNERLNTKNNLDRLSRAKADQLERLDYDVYSVSVSREVIVDLDTIKNSWINELQNFVRNFNEMLQGLTVKLLSFALILLQVAIYLIIALFIGKYGWRFVKFVWKK
ncbi:MAG: hypothetical protein V1851_00920 [Patescibacteria group bacterium]